MKPRCPWGIVVAALCSTIAIVPAADAALVKSGESSAAFHAVATGGMKITGTTHDLAVTETGGKIEIDVPLSGLDTGIALRNKHLREKYLEVSKFPQAQLTVERSALKLPAEQGQATGMMTIHGQTKPVLFRYTARLSNGSYVVNGSTRINIKDFGIEVPSYMGVEVKPDVDVDVQFSAAER